MSLFADKAYHGIVARSAVLLADYRYGFTNDAGDSFPLSPFVCSRPNLLSAEGRRRGLATIGASNRPRVPRLCGTRRTGGAEHRPRPYTKNQHSTPRLRSELDKTQVLYPPPQALAAVLRVLVRCPPRTIQNSGFVNVRRKAQDSRRQTNYSANSTETADRPPRVLAPLRLGSRDVRPAAWRSWSVCRHDERDFFQESVDIVRQMEYNNLGGAFMDRERLQIRISADLLQQIERSARIVGISKSEFCRMAIIQYITRMGENGADTTTRPIGDQ